LKLLHVDCSPKGARSNSRMLGQHFIERLRRTAPMLIVDHLDLAANPPPHITEAFTIATYVPQTIRTPEMHQALAISDALCKRLLGADALLFAMPMYNWTVPSVFKAFIDNIVRQDVTYSVDTDGRYVGKLGAKKTVFLTTRGADLRSGSPLADMDALTPVLRAAFGFMGILDPVFVDAQPVQFAQEADRSEALVRAYGELSAIADRWSES
jgi:FMN-dependent NADH-azoreductase